METTVKSVTPPHGISTTPSIQDTPLGQSDRHPKLQICLEYRKKEINKSKNRKIQKILEVTVMWVKNLPQWKGKQPNPVVKLRLMPGDIIRTTDNKTDRSDVQYIEIFEFPITSKNLKGFILEIQVCNRKVTRNAKSFGTVCIPLDDLIFDQPLVQWHKLNLTENEEQEDTKKSVKNGDQEDTIVLSQEKEIMSKCTKTKYSF